MSRLPCTLPLIQLSPLESLMVLNLGSPTRLYMHTIRKWRASINEPRIMLPEFCYSHFLAKNVQ